MKAKHIMALLGAALMAAALTACARESGEVPVSYTHLDVYKRQAERGQDVCGEPLRVPGQYAGKTDVDAVGRGQW